VLFRSGASSGESPLQLELVLAYEDAPTALRAKRALEGVLSKPEINARPRLHLWRLDLLHHPEMKQRAAQTAADADVLVVAMHGRERLTPQAEGRLKEWISLRRAKPCALVISLDADAKPLAEANPALAELRAAARRNGLTLMLHFGEPPRSLLNAALAGLRGPPASMPPYFDPPQGPPDLPRDWGINE